MDDMTEEQILARAAEITARRERQARGNAFYTSDNIAIVLWENGYQQDIIDEISIEPSAELAALLCKVLDVRTIGKP